MSVALALIFFPLLMAYAASSDLLTMTIANWISIALALGFLMAAAIARLAPTEILLNLSCGLAVLSCAFILFCFGWIGGGDAKLAAATAVWLGWSHLLDYGVLASVLGGALTLALVGLRSFSLPPWARAAWTDRLHDPKTGVPYGIALAAAGLLVYPTSQIWMSLNAA